MIIGFGSTEQEVQRTFEGEFRSFVTRRFQTGGLLYFTDEIVAEAVEWLADAAREMDADAARYKVATAYPDRYSTISPRLLSDASTIVVVVKFSHINRRHALSPDGWAMMQVEHCFAVHSYDTPTAEAA
jgi:hypothetical protein